MATRRGRGDGVIRRRPDGRWEAIVDLGWQEGKRVRRSFYGRTRAEAAAKLRASQIKADHGLPQGDGRLTVGTWLGRWLELQQRGPKAGNTIAQYEWAIEKHWVPAIGRKKLAQLSADDVDDVLAARAATGAARNTLIRLRSVLVMALDQAVRRDLVVRNVAALTDTPDGPKTEGRSLTVDQARTLLDAAVGDRLEAAYVTLLMLGLRPGELLGLAWDAVNLDDGEISVRQALKVERGTKVVIGPLKTAGSRRTLAVPKQVQDALRTHRQRQIDECRVAGPNWIESGLVFTTTLGTAIDPRNFRRSFTRMTERAGLGRWHPNELRHSAVSLLSAAGVREEDVADIVGHVTTRMTHRVYRHLVAPAITAGKETMERLFAPTATEPVHHGHD